MARDRLNYSRVIFSSPLNRLKDMDKASKPHTEIELKLSLSATAHRDLRKHPSFQAPFAGPPTSRHEMTTYFDTPDEKLKRDGLSLRVRRSNGKRVQTVKARGIDGVAASRGEWQWPVEQARPDLSLAAQTPVADRLPLDLSDKLQPVVSTDIDRTVYMLRPDGETLIEAAIDSGTIAAGKAHEAVNELELELRRGETVSLYRLAIELQAVTPLRLTVESKAERGFRLKDGSTPAVRKAEEQDLDSDETAGEGFRHIVASGLGHLLANQAAAGSGNVEGVHQMRVAIRRLRAALMLFEPHLEPHIAARFEAELRRIGQVFGAARDWDVFCTEILPSAVEDAESANWVELLRAPAEARCKQAHIQFNLELDAPSFTAFVLGMAAWVEDGRRHRRLLGEKELDTPLAQIAPGLLDRLARKVDKRGRHIERRSDIKLHALRKSHKKLRYAVEYLAPLYPHKAVKAYVRRCKDVQQSLGAINDAAAATRLAEGLAEGNRVDLAAALGVLAQHLERRRQKARRDLEENWSAFHGGERPWS
jgi:triphosphatase